MKKTLFLVLVFAYALASPSIAATFPSYYPVNGFPNTGRVDAVYLEESRIVIGDLPYKISESVVVRTLRSKSDSLARIREGAKVGFRTSRRDVIEEFWLLPSNYEAPRRR